MGFFDHFTGKAAGATGSWIGSLGDGLGIASAFTDGKTSDGLGIASGGVATISNLMGIGGGIGTLLDKKADSDDKLDAWFDMGEGSIGALGGIADMAAGGFGLRDNHKGKGVSQMISGGLGILGGLLSGGKAIYDIKKAHTKDKNGKSGSVEDKVAAWTKLGGSVTSLFNGIVNIGQGRYEYSDQSDSAAGKRWAHAGKAGAIAGIIPGLIGSALQTKEAVDFSKRKKK